MTNYKKKSKTDIDIAQRLHASKKCAYVQKYFTETSGCWKKFFARNRSGTVPLGFICFVQSFRANFNSRLLLHVETSHQHGGVEG